MKLKTVLFLLVLLVVPTGYGQSLDSGPWPTLSHDNQRTNRSNLSGPANPGSPTLLYDAGSPISLGNTTVTSDGKILLSSCTPQVIALTTTGSPVGAPWPYSLVSAGASGIPEAVGFTVSADGHIYVPTHECPDIPGGVPARYHSIKSNGMSETDWPISSSAMYDAPAISTDGTIIQMDEFNIIHAYRPDGSLVWTQGTAGYGQGDVALDSANNIYVGTDGNIYGGQTLFSFTSTGMSRPGWPRRTGTFAAATTPVVGTGDIVYFVDASGALYSFNSDGSLRAGFPFNAGGTVSTAPLALSASGTVYLKTSLGLFAINPNGTPAWASPFAPGGDPSLSPGPVVDANGSIYVAFGDAVYSLDPNGNVRSGWPVGIPSAEYVVIGGSGILYVVSAGQKLYAVGSGSAPVPMVSLSPSPLNFPSQTVSTPGTALAVTVANTGNATLTITNAPAVSGTNAGDFAIASGTTCTSGANIASGNSCVVEVIFTPSAATPESASLSIYDNAVGNPQTVGLSGTGIVPILPPPTISSFSPPQSFLGAQVSPFIITGTNFQSGAIVAFSGSGIDVDPASVTVAPTQIEGNLTVSPQAAGGSYSVTVTNPDGGTTTFSTSLNVLAVPPIPQGVSAVVGNQIVHLQWSGDGSVPEGYNVYLNGVLTNSSGLIQNSGFGITGLQNGQIYRFDLTAVGSGGESGRATIFAEPNAFVAPPHPLHPVLFLHGINADATAWETTADFLTGTLGWACGGTLAYLPQDNPNSVSPHDAFFSSNPPLGSPSACKLPFSSAGDFFTVDFGNNLANYPDDRGIFHQGDEVAGFIREINTNNKLSIVAWSMGGLAARSYMQVTDPIHAPSQISDLITLGTPHWGVDRNYLTNPDNTARVLLGRVFGINLVPVLKSRGLFDMDGGCVSNMDSTNYGSELSQFLQEIDFNGAFGLPRKVRYVAVSGLSYSRPDECGGLLASKTLSTDWVVPSASSTFAALLPNGTWQSLATADVHTSAISTWFGGTALPDDVTAILCALDQNCLELKVMSPVDVQVTAPNGLIISNNFASIPGADYTTVSYPDGHETSAVLIPFPKGGQYTITVTPKPGAQPTDTFTILQTQDGVTTTIAENMQIATIPPSGFQTTAKNGSAFTVNFGGSVQQPITNDGNGHFIATVAMTNQGNVTVDSIQIATAGTKLGTVSATSASGPIASLAPGASTTVMLTFPITSALATATSAPLRIIGTYSAGTLTGNWGLTFRSVTLGTSIIGEN